VFPHRLLRVLKKVISQIAVLFIKFLMLNVYDKWLFVTCDLNVACGSTQAALVLQQLFFRQLYYLCLPEGIRSE
jgi:hypothetical protein